MFNRERKDGKGLLSVSSVEKAYSTLSWIIRYCSEVADPPLMEENYLNKIRFKTLVPKGRGKKIRKDRSHSLKEIKLLISTLRDKANIRLKTMINIFVDVGCRVEECIGLKWSNINLNTGEITYTEAVTSSISQKYSKKYSGIRKKQLKSDNSYRNNYLTPETIQYLKNLKTFQRALGLPANDDDYIFTTWEENMVISPISFTSEYSLFRKKYNFVNIPPYDLRHVITNLLLESGMSPKDVASYMGNTARTLLESYTETSKETKKEIRGTVNNALRSNTQKIFTIETIAEVLNYNNNDIKEDVYSILDFVANRTISSDEVPFVMENAKSLILDQYPIFETFCDSDENIVKAKVDTYKAFNDSDIELTQNPNYYLSNIKI